MAEIEFGSFFDVRVAPKLRTSERPFDPGALLGNGRQAILAAFEDLELRSGARRLLIPTYFCEEVVEWLASRIMVERYACAPFETAVEIRTRSDEAVLVVEYFGDKSQVVVNGDGAAIVDRTHMPWATYDYDFEVDAVAGSLRKAFPVADGGFVRLPIGRSLRRELRLRSEHVAASRQVRDAMILKTIWLENGGSASAKEEFLRCHRRGEERMSTGDASAMTKESLELLRGVSTAALDEARRGNVARFSEAVSGRLNGVEVIQTPSFAVLRCPSESDRNRLRSALIQRDVFPAVLWPLGADAPREHSDLSGRIISLHADFRYSLAEMGMLANDVANAWSEASNG